MKALHIILIGISLLSISVRSYSQINKIQDSTIYKAELFGSAATGSNTPFWMVSNRYGVVPLDAGNGLLNAGVFHNQHSVRSSTGAQGWISLQPYHATVMFSFNRLMRK